MEEKINVAEILKDKPKGTKLYSDICCGECVLNEVSENAIYVDMYNKERFWDFSVYGTIYAFPDGSVLLYPSKEMRDWRKFAWKKGDVLVSTDRNVHIIFEKFEDDAYTKFRGKYYLWEEGDSMVSFEENEYYMQTSDFNKANKEDAQEYIHKIEKRLGGKLNRKTLEVEKTHPEFKDGDIITFKDRIILIYSTTMEVSPERTEIYYHACLKEGELTVNEYLMSYGFGEGWCSSTEEEKKQLFSALAKEGKAWDAEKKEIVVLKPKWTPKPFDRVITRNAADDVWTANFFSHMDSHGEYVTIACVGGYTYCLPYNEETAKLIGTTNNWEG